jgi:hypothetical protein
VLCFGLATKKQGNRQGGLMREYDSQLVSRWRFTSLLLDVALIISVSSLLL